MKSYRIVPPLLSIPVLVFLLFSAPANAQQLDAASIRFQLLYPPHHGFTDVTETTTPDTLFKRTSQDRWFAFDKVQHTTFRFLWTLGTQYTLENKAEWSHNGALPVSLCSGAAVGLAKELYDWQIGPTRHFSKRDLVADALGLVLAAGLIAL